MFKVGDKVKRPGGIMDTVSEITYGLKNGGCSYREQELEPIPDEPAKEQRPEPKFKVGDWVVKRDSKIDDNTFQVFEVFEVGPDFYGMQGEKTPDHFKIDQEDMFFKIDPPKTRFRSGEYVYNKYTEKIERISHIFFQNYNINNGKIRIYYSNGYGDYHEDSFMPINGVPPFDYLRQEIDKMKAEVKSQYNKGWDGGYEAGIKYGKNEGLREGIEKGKELAREEIREALGLKEE